MKKPGPSPAILAHEKVGRGGKKWAVDMMGSPHLRTDDELALAERKARPRVVIARPSRWSNHLHVDVAAAEGRLMGAVEGHYQVLDSSRFKPPGNVDIYVSPNEVVIEPHENVLTIEVDPATAIR